jgi:stearoyl-CoA desaturase (delta-9 desaturase)
LNLLLAVALAFATSQLAMFATTIYLHRGMTHGALKLRPVAAFPLRLILWLATGIRPRDWVGVHRRHHATVDTEDDPHSPIVRGFWRVQLGNIVLYHRAAHDRPMVARYTRDMKPNWLDKLVFNRETLGPVLGLGLLCLLFGWQTGLMAGAFHVVFYVGFNGAVNSVGHTSGRQPNENTARNGLLLALFTAGEGFHNNHHALPTAARFSWRRFEFDPAWWLIRTLQGTGLLTLRHPLGLIPARI